MAIDMELAPASVILDAAFRDPEMEGQLARADSIRARRPDNPE